MLIGWDKITIKDYLEILDIVQDTDDPKEKINRSIQVLSYLTGNPEEYYYNLPVNEAVQEINKLSFLSDFKLIPGYKPSKKIRVGDRDFKMILPEEMTYGQFIDYQSYSQNSEIASILSIFLIPVEAKRYNDGYDLAEIQDYILNHLNFRVAQSMLGFILAKYTKLLVRSLKYLAKKDPKIQNQVNDLLLLLKTNPLSIFTLGSVHLKE